MWYWGLLWAVLTTLAMMFFVGCDVEDEDYDYYNEDGKY